MAKKSPPNQANLLEQYQTWDEVAPPTDDLVKTRLQEAFVNRHWDIVDYHHSKGHSIDLTIEVPMDKKTIAKLKQANVTVEYGYNEKKNTALHMPSMLIAVLDDDADRVKWLLARGISADQSGKRWSDDKKNATLQFAAALGSNRAARALLVGGAQPDYQGPWHHTPLRAAELTGNVLGAAMITHALEHQKRTRDPLTEEALSNPAIFAAALHLAALQPPPPKGWGARLRDSFNHLPWFGPKLPLLDSKPATKQVELEFH